MLINFALECVGTVVSCDKVSTDGYECTNLVNSNWFRRKRGFIAEHFIKPPVNITFSFPCNIQIYQVFVTPYVGQQLSSLVEIYSASEKSRHKEKNLNLPTKGTSASYSSLKNPSLNSSVTDDNAPPPLFYQVSKCSVPNYGRICFTNPKFNSQTSSSDVSEDASLCPYRTTMQHFRKEIMTSSSHLSIRLVQTQHGSSVAVSSVDIWGVPALSVISLIKTEVTANFLSFMRPKLPSRQTNKEHIKTRTSDSKLFNEKQEQELEMPEEFIDPLTCEVMSIPMLLPCGKNVDKSTLDRFFSSEEVYGRSPRDPFTGVVFSNNSQPVPNIALKSRIDQFLFKHRDNKATSSVARTVSVHPGVSFLGKRDGSGQRTGSGISSLVACASNQISSSSIGLTDQSKHFNMSNNYNISIPHSLKQSSQTPLPRQNSVCNPSSIEETASFSNSSIENPDTCNQLHSLTEHKSHEHKLKESLNSALTSLLGKASSKHSTQLTIPSKGCESDLFKCSSCKESQSKDAVVYNSPCNHMICRRCLTKQSSSLVITCGACGRQCQREHFIRRHYI